MSTELRAHGLTDVGQARDLNEDSYFVGATVFAVADGLGGHQAGEVASDLALEPIRSADAAGARKAAAGIADAVRKANKAVLDRSQSEPELSGMGTTLTAVAIDGGIAHLAHVGDSRCYLIRSGQITQLTRDHTLVARMVDEGKITPEQAESHPQRSVLTRALGAERQVDVQTENIVLQRGDRLILCSDGLSGVLSDQDLLEMVGTGADLDEICHNLIQEANERGGPDNITAVVVDVASTPAVGSAPVPDGFRAPRALPVRALVWSAIVLVAVVGGWLGVRAWANGSYYVGVDEQDNVAIYQGLPVDVLGMSLSKLAEPTEVQAAKIDSPAIRRSLEDGIRASSLADATRIVTEQICPNLNDRTPPPICASDDPDAEPSP